MRWLTILLAVAFAASSARAAETTFVVPLGYTVKSAAGTAYVERARSHKETVSVEVTVYASPNDAVQLTRVLWVYRPVAKPTRASLEEFDRSLAANDIEPVAERITDVRVFDGDQLIGEGFDRVAGKRIYHRRVYAADTSGLVHLFWLICRGPADQIEPCENAQRSMELAVAKPASLPPDPSAAPRIDLPPALEGTNVVMPPEFEELQGPSRKELDDHIAQIRASTGTLRASGALYRNDAGVTLTRLQWTIYLGLFGANRQTIEELDRMFALGTASGGGKRVSHSLTLVGDQLVADQIDDTPSGIRVHQRRVYGLDYFHILHVFILSCAGHPTKLASCEQALEDMRLTVPSPVTPPDKDAIDKPAADKPAADKPAADKPESTATARRSTKRSLGGLIANAAFAALVVGLVAWVIQSARRGSRRRRRR